MKTKKVNVSVFNYGSYHKVVSELVRRDIVVLKQSYNGQYNRYDILTEMNIDQCKEMLKFVKSIDGILWKGE